MILEKTSMKTVVAGALGECVHIAGVTNFLSLFKKAGWGTVLLGGKHKKNNYAFPLG
jgi:hypothetical protein